MYSRKDSTQFPVEIPPKHFAHFEKAIDEVFGTKINQRGETATIHGLLYPGEFVIGLCFHNQSQQTQTPTSFIISIDIEQKERDQEDQKLPNEKVLQILMDFLGLMTEQYLSEDEWTDYLQKWEFEEFQKLQIYYLISRDNIPLTLQANRLLNQ